MTQMVIGIILEIWFILAIVGGAVFHPPLSVTFVLFFSIILFVPGVVLIVLGMRRVALFKRVGAAAIAAARETGRISLEDVAERTQISRDEVLLVVNTLIRKGIIPPDCEVS